MKKYRAILICSLLAFNIVTIFAQTDVQIGAFAKSIKLEREKDYSAAIAAMNEVYNEKSYEVNLRLGWLNYKSGNYKESMNHYQIAAGLNPNSLEANEGYLYPILANSDVAANDFEVLMKQYNKILEIKPKDVNSNYQYGFHYYNKGNFDQAQKYFSKIVDLYPSGYEYYLRVALAKINKTKTVNDKAIEAFKKSYDSEIKGDYTSAITVLKDIYDPKYYDVNFRLGYLYYMAGQYAESIKYYQVAIDLKPGSVEPRLGYTYPAYQLGNKDNLFAQYKTIVELDPQNTFVLYKLGMAYYEKKDYASANTAFEKIVTLYPFTYDGLLMNAWSNYRLNKPSEAKVLFRKVLMLSPNDRSAMEGLALIK